MTLTKRYVELVVCLVSGRCRLFIVNEKEAGMRDKEADGGGGDETSLSHKRGVPSGKTPCLLTVLAFSPAVRTPGDAFLESESVTFWGTEKPSTSF